MHKNPYFFSKNILNKSVLLTRLAMKAHCELTEEI